MSFVGKDLVRGDVQEALKERRREQAPRGIDHHNGQSRFGLKEEKSVKCTLSLGRSGNLTANHNMIVKYFSALENSNGCHQAFAERAIMLLHSVCEREA